ncbi:MAG TPA: hypothetical protein V6D29_04200 [Leptolyngbyaceae cyanobacterium]
MRNRRLPCLVIVRNVCLGLLVWSGALLFVADIHAAANNQFQKTESLQRLFIYQIAMKFKALGS